MIIDESDERMFRDLDAFYRKTKSEKVYTICLTATAYEGSNTGIMRRVIDELGYKIYTNNNKQEDFDPTVHKTIKLVYLEDKRAFINKESLKCGVLIYANDTDYDVLKQEDGVISVT